MKVKIRIMLLKKQLIFVIFVILLSSIVTAVMCEVTQVRSSLKASLYDFLTNPSGAELNVSEVKDLLVFYLGISEEAVTVDCSEVGGNSGLTITDIMNKASGITLPTCTGGVQYGECSTDIPKYCYAGNLVDKCGLCGCTSGQLCLNDTGVCNQSAVPITCNVDANCGTNGYVADLACTGNNITKDYVKYTCNNPNTESSYCSNSTTAVVIDTCDYGCSDGACVAQDDIIYLDSCGTLDEAGEYYQLNKSITTTEACFVIEADEIILDLGGYSITGDGSLSDYGVYINGHNDIIIKNGKIYGFMDGVYLSSSSGNTITDITANSNMGTGIRLALSSNNNQLTGNTADSNFAGISLVSSSGNNQMTGNTVNSNSIYGIFIDSSNNNQLIGNTADSNPKYGISLDSSNNNQIINNIANSNGWYGISLDESSNNNQLIGNTVNSNNDGGIYLFVSSNNNTIRGNKVNSCIEQFSCVGIYLDSSSGNTIEDNTANSNLAGISLSSSSDNEIINNMADSNNFNGIILKSSSNNVISGNTANSCWNFGCNGIFLGDSSNNNQLTGNTVSSNSDTGIYLRSSSDNVISGNTVNSNPLGIGIYQGSNNNNLTNNNFCDNVNTDCYIPSLGLPSSGNTGAGNYFNVSSGCDSIGHSACT